MITNLQPQPLLEAFRARHGLDRVLDDGTPTLYALTRTFDHSTEEFREKWSVVGIGESDSETTVSTGMAQCMQVLSQGLDEAEVPEQVPAVLAVAFVTYGLVSASVSFDELSDISKLDAQEVGLATALDAISNHEENRLPSRIIDLVSLRGMCTQVTVKKDGGVIYDRLIEVDVEKNLDDADEMTMGGAHHEALVKGFSQLVLFGECARERGSLFPTEVVRHALDRDFPWKGALVRAVCHALVAGIDYESMPDDTVRDLLRFIEQASVMSDEERRETKKEMLDDLERERDRANEVHDKFRRFRQ
jgi:hypothetical protein